MYVKAIVFAFVLAVGAYFIGLFACLFLLPLISSNTHDVQLEAAMTGAFVVGPLFGIVGFGAGLFIFLARRKR